MSRDDEIEVDMTVHGLLVEVEAICEEARNPFTRSAVEANSGHIVYASVKLQALAAELIAALKAAA